MNRTAKAEDIMGIGQIKVFRAYDTDDGWTVVTPGAESGRRQAQGKKVHALSKVEIRLQSKKDLAVCIAHLEESDRRFAMINSNPWDWTRAMFKELTVRFGVEWYDKDFFEQRKEAYLSAEHVSMYSQFGATVNDFTVEHYLTDEDGHIICGAQSSYPEQRGITDRELN